MLEETLYELWDEGRIPIQPHSHLYHLEPIGVGSPMVECLTSYIIRLADAHSLYPHILFTKEILPLVNSSHLQRADNGKYEHEHLSSFWKESAFLNGIAHGTYTWIQALEQLTGRHDLQSLTMLTFAEFTAYTRLIRRTRAWCPICYEEWREKKLIIYEPLLWMLESVTICVRHRFYLQSTCPYPDCQYTLRPLDPKSLPGYCSKCHRWLGYRGGKNAYNISQPANEEWHWQQWIEQSVGELLSAIPTLSVYPRKDYIAEIINTYLSAAPENSRKALARELNISSRSIRDWLRGKYLPQLGNLLRICFLFNLTPLCVLTGRALQTSISLKMNSLDTGLFKSNPRKIKRFNAEQVKPALDAALQEDPAPSMRHVARRVGFSLPHLYKHFPELCHAISRRYQAVQAEMGNARLQKLCDELREAIRMIDEQGLYPSWSQIKKVLAKPGILRELKLREIIDLGRES